MNPAYPVYIGLILARVGAFVAVMPPFATRTPRIVRAAFAVVLTAFYLNASAPHWDPHMAAHAANPHPLRYALALVREVLLGASMGFTFALFLLPTRIAGEFITLQVGLNAAPTVGPTGSESGGPLANLFETAGGLLFLVLDVHHAVFRVFHSTFDIFPLGGTILPEANRLLSGLASAYEMGLMLAGPLALCMFLLSVTLAIMSRAAPQLNVYSIGFTLQVCVVLAGTLFLLPEIVRAIAIAVERTGETLPVVLGG